jgi:hypothetical protein
MNREKLVGADAEPAVAQFPGERRKLRRLLLEAIDKDEVVAAAVHLGELELHLLFQPIGVGVLE